MFTPFWRTRSTRPAGPAHRLSLQVEPLEDRTLPAVTGLPIAAIGGPLPVAVADVNGDGRPDIVTVNTDSNDVSVFLENADGTYQQTQSLAVGVAPSGVAVADLNGDGRPDIVTANAFTND